MGLEPDSSKALGPREQSSQLKEYYASAHLTEEKATYTQEDHEKVEFELEKGKKWSDFLKKNISTKPEGKKQSIELEGEKQWDVVLIDSTSLTKLAKTAAVEASSKELLCRLHKKTVKQWNPKTPFTATLVKYIAAPVIAFCHFLCKGKKQLQDEREKQALNKLVQAINPNSPKAFRHLLKRQLAIYERAGLTDDPAFLPLKNALENSCNVSKAIKHDRIKGNKKEIESLCEQFAKDLDTKNNKNPLLTLTSGVYVNGIFNPALLTFTRDPGTNELMLHQQIYLRSQGSHETSITYNLSKLNEKTLAKLLEELLMSQNRNSKEEQGITAKEAKQIEVFKRGLATEEITYEKSSGSKTETTERPSEFEWFECLVLLNGGTVKSKSKETFRDGLDLLGSFLESYDEHEKSTQTYLAFAMLHEELLLLEKHIDSLNPEERIEAIQEVKDRLSVFKNGIKKHFGSLNQLELLYSDSDPLTQFKTRLDDMEKKILEDSQQTQKKLEETLRSPIKVDEKQTVGGTVPVAMLKSPGEAMQLTKANPLHVHAQALQELKNQFTLNNIEDAKKQFNQLSESVDKLLNEERYADAIALANAVQGMLPVPSQDLKNFWNQFGTTPENIQKLEAWGKEITKLSKFQWEAFTHLHRRHMQPEELLNGMNVRAICVKVARMKSKAAIEKAIKFKFKEDNRNTKEEIHYLTTLIKKFQKNQDLSNEDVKRLNSYGIYANSKDASKDKESLKYEEPLKYEEVAAIVFTDFQTDLPQFNEILEHHPFYRFSDDPALDAKALGIVQFLKFKDIGVSEDPKVIRLDASVDAPNKRVSMGEFHKSYHEKSDNDYLKAILNIQKFFGNVNNLKTENELLIKGTGFPEEIQDLRHVTAMFQCMYRPEFCMALSFDNSPLEKLKAINWVQNTYKEASEKISNPKQLPAECSEIAYTQLSKQIDQMRRLEFEMGKYVLNGKPVMRFVDSKHRDLRIDYLPWGLELPDEFKGKILTAPNDLNAAPLAGTLPQDWVTSLVGDTDNKKSSSSRGKGNEFTMALKKKPTYTEHGHLRTCLRLNENRDFVNEWLLRTLEISEEDSDGSYSFQPEVVLDALSFIRERPDLLESVEVQRRLELILFRPYLLQRMIRKEPEFFDQFSEDLKTLIEAKIATSQDTSASFLMHIGDRLHAHVTEAIQTLETKDPYGVKKFSQDSLKNYLKNFVDAIPRYSTEYALPDRDPIKGMQILANWMGDTEKDRGALKVRQMEAIMYCNQHPTPNAIKEMDLQDIFALIDGRNLLPYAGQIIGLPMSCARMQSWYDNEFFNNLQQALSNDPDFCKTFLNNVLEQQLSSDEIQESLKENTTGTWKSSEKSPMIFTKGNTTIDLSSGDIINNGKKVARKPQEVRIPKEIRVSFPKFQRFFGNQEIKAKVSSGRNSNEWVYEWEHNGQLVRVVHDNREETLAIFKQFAKVGQSKQWYRHQAVDVSKAPQGFSQIVGQCGLWLNEKTPRESLLVPLTDKGSELTGCYFVQLSNTGSIEKVVDALDKTKVVHADSDSSLAKIFPMAHPNHVVYLRKEDSDEITEIRFLDMGFAVQKDAKSGEWKAKGGGLDDYQLMVNKLTNTKSLERSEALKQVFGKDFPEFALQLSKESEQSIVMWPHSINQEKVRNRVLIHQPYIKDGTVLEHEAQPLLVLRINDKGEMTTSSAGFLYLAYLSSAKGDYQRAIQYFTKAKCSATLETPEDRHIFERVAKFFKENKPIDLEATAFQLKAELFLLKIRQQQLGKDQFDPVKWSEHFDEVQRLSDLFDQYNTLSERSRKGALHLPEILIFSENELNDLNSMRLEGMRFFLDAYKESVKGQEEKGALETVTFSGIKENEITTQFYSLLVVMAADSGKKTKEELCTPVNFTAELVLRNFITYYNMIISGDLQKKDIQFLFRPFSDAQQANKELISEADKARRLLIQLAFYRGQFTESEYEKLLKNEEQLGVQCIPAPIDLKKLINLRNLTPKKPQDKSNTIQGIIKIGYETSLRLVYTEENFQNALNNVMSNSGVSAAVNPIKKTLSTALSVTYDSKKPLLRLVELKTEIQPVPDQKVNELSVSSEEKFPAGIAVPKPFPTTGQRLVDLDSFEKAIKNVKEGRTISQFEISTLEKIAKTLREGNAEDAEKVYEIEAFISLVKMNSNISLFEIRRTEELARRADHLERKIKNEVDTKPNPVEMVSHSIPKELFEELNLTNDLSEYFVEADQNRVSHLKQVSKDLRSQFSTTDKEPMEQQENTEIVNGLQNAENSLIAAAKVRRVANLSKKDCLALIKDLNNKNVDIVNKRDYCRDKILKWAKQQTADPKFKQMLEAPDLYGDQELLDQVIDIYQTQQMKTSISNIDDIESMVTTYLLIATTVQQMEIGLKEAKSLLSLFDKKDKIPQNKMTTWNEKSAALHELLSRGFNVKRYMKDNKLEDPQFSRKYLVAEFRSGRILRDGQIKEIKNLVNNPEQWVSLRMGLGKSSFIMPIVASLLAEKGILPVLLVSSGLKEINISDFDKRTRQLYGRRAYPFNFTAETGNTSAQLAETYNKFLKVYQERGYIVTSVDSLAQIKNLRVALADERTKLLAAIKSEKDESEKQSLGFKSLQLQKKIHWISKIESLLNGCPKSQKNQVGKLPIPTTFFGDEVDSIFNITKEINQAVGEKIPPNPTIKKLTKSIFNIILETKDGNQASLLNKLKEHLLEGTLGSIKPEDLEEKFLPAIAKQLLQQSDDFATLLNEKSINEDKMVRFLTGELSELPQNLPPWDDKANPDSSEYAQQVLVATAKAILSTKLKGVFSQEGGISFGLSEGDGAVIVPKDKQTEISGNRFGDEFDLIAYQYLGYIQALSTQTLGDSSKTFLLKALATLEDRDPELYQEMKRETGSDNRKKIAEKLLEKNYYSYRLIILENYVFAGGYINRHHEQITQSVQGTVIGRSVGGISGTLNKYGLPNYDPNNEKKEASTREVEAETFIQMAINHENGADVEVEYFAESKKDITDYMNKLLEDSKTAAIINEGGYGMKGMTIGTWVEELRNLEKGKNRSFMFIMENTEGRRKAHIWENGVAVPREYKEGGAIPTNCVCVFSPQDTRGTDLPIPEGNTHYLPLRTTNLQELGQSIWRGRGTGQRHTPYIHLPKSMYEQLPEGKKTLAEFVDIVKLTGLKQQGPQNLKAQLFRVKEIATLGAQDLLFGTRPELDQESYWTEGNKDIFVADLNVDDTIYDIFRDYFVKKKEVDFKAFYAPSEEVPTVGQIAETYTKEVSKLKEKKGELIEKVTVMVMKAQDMKEDENTQEQMKSVLENAFNIYEKTPGNDQERMKSSLISALSNKQDSIRTEAANEFTNKLIDKEIFNKNMKEDEYKKEITDEIKKIIEKSEKNNTNEEKLKAFNYNLKGKIYESNPQLKMLESNLLDREIDSVLNEEKAKSQLELLFNGLGEIDKIKTNIEKDEKNQVQLLALARFAKTSLKIDNIVSQIEQEKVKFRENQQTHSKYLPATTQCSSEGASSQEQVQQQQQQQEVERTVLPDVSDDTTPLNNKFSKWDLSDVFKPPNKENPLPNISSKMVNMGDNMVKMDSELVNMSCELPHCNLKSVRFTPELMKLVEILPALRGEAFVRFCVTDKGVTAMTRTDFHYFTKNFDPWNKGLFGIYSSVKDEMKYMIGAQKKPDLQQECLNIAQTKLLLGYAAYSKEEKKALNQWYNELSPEGKKEICNWFEKHGITIKFPISVS